MAGKRVAPPMGAAPGDMMMLQLIDRRTGSVHRVDGRPVTAWVSRQAAPDARAQMMENRDPDVWAVRSMEPGAASPARAGLREIGKSGGSARALQHAIPGAAPAPVQGRAISGDSGKQFRWGRVYNR